MVNKNEAVFMKITCGTTGKLFYLRYDYAADDCWVLTYGIKESDLPRQVGGSGATQHLDLTSSRTGPQYKCPYCGNIDFIRCECGALTCYDGGTYAKCYSCGSEGEVTGLIESIKEEGVFGAAQ